MHRLNLVSFLFDLYNFLMSVNVLFCYLFVFLFFNLIEKYYVKFKYYISVSNHTECK